MKDLRRGLQAMVKTPQEQTGLRGSALRGLLLAVLALWLATALLCTRLHAQDKPPLDTRSYEERLKAEREAAEYRAKKEAEKAKTDAQTKIKKEEQARKDKEEQKINLAEYKEKTLQNLSQIKELFASAEAAFKEKQYAKAASFYQSVAGASAPGSEDMAQKSRDKLVGMEDLAKASLKAAEDADMEGNYIKEVEALSVITSEFKDTKAREIALRRLISLKSKPEVAAEVEYVQAESMLGEGKMLQSIEILKGVAGNSRYDNSVAQFKARRKLDELKDNDDAQAKIKAEQSAKVEKEAPALMSAAKNFMSNHMPKLAIEKLKMVIDKFPGSTYADEARKQLEELQ
jgi:hypothetical protein